MGKRKGQSTPFGPHWHYCSPPNSGTLPMFGSSNSGRLASNPIHTISLQKARIVMKPLGRKYCKFPRGKHRVKGSLRRRGYTGWV